MRGVAFLRDVFRAEPRDLPMKKRRSTRQEIVDRRQLVHIVLGERDREIAVEALEQRVDAVCRVGERREYLLAAVFGVANASHEAGTLEPGDDACDGARRQTGQPGQMTARQSALLAEQVIALEISRPEAQTPGEGMVKEHRRGAEPAHALAGDCPHEPTSCYRPRHKTSSYIA